MKSVRSARPNAAAASSRTGRPWSAMNRNRFDQTISDRLMPRKPASIICRSNSLSSSMVKATSTCERSAESGGRDLPRTCALTS